MSRCWKRCQSSSTLCTFPGSLAFEVLQLFCRRCALELCVRCGVRLTAQTVIAMAAKGISHASCTCLKKCCHWCGFFVVRCWSRRRFSSFNTFCVHNPGRSSHHSPTQLFVAGAGTMFTCCSSAPLARWPGHRLAGASLLGCILGLGFALLSAVCPARWVDDRGAGLWETSYRLGAPPVGWMSDGPSLARNIIGPWAL